MNIKVKIIIAVSILAILALPVFVRVTIIKTSESGVVTKWGKIQDETFREGVHFYFLGTRVKKIDMRERTTTINTTTVSKEGLKFGVKITVRYQVKRGQEVQLVKGLKNELHELINTFTNATIDDVATGKDKNEMYSDTGRVAIIKAVKEKLNNELKDYAQINQVIFEDIQLPKSITEAIQKQQAELEKIKQKENEKLVAEKQADIKRIEAQGIADANRIINNSLTPEYLKYEAIQKFNSGAEKIYIPASGLVPVINY